MTWLNRIGIGWWWLISVAFCYLLWNPSGYSISHYVLFSDDRIAIRIMVGLICAGILLVYVLEAWRTLGILGFAFFGAATLVMVWIMVDYGVLTTGNAGSTGWWSQLVVGTLMTVGLQGSKIYRNLTGRTPVLADQHAAVHHDTGHHGGHH